RVPIIVVPYMGPPPRPDRTSTQRHGPPGQLRADAARSASARNWARSPAGWGDYAELHEHREAVHLAPVLHDLPVGEPVDGDARHLHVLVGRRDAHELTGVLATP